MVINKIASNIILAEYNLLDIHALFWTVGERQGYNLTRGFAAVALEGAVSKCRNNILQLILK